MEYIVGEWASYVCFLYLFRLLSVNKFRLGWVYITEYWIFGTASIQTCIALASSNRDEVLKLMQNQNLV